MDSVKKGWFSEIGEMWPGHALSFEVSEVLFDERSQYQHIQVFQTPAFGRVLVLDGVIQVTEKDEFAYQEMIAHLPLASHANPRKALVIGGGDGGVLREIARNKQIEEIHICEIDEMVISTSKKFFPALACGFDDPRVHVHVMDGAIFVKELADDFVFDAIIVDSSDPIGPAESLFKKEFFVNMQRKLSPEGVMCTQAENIWLHMPLITDMIAFLREVFASVEYAYTTIPTYPGGQIGFFILSSQTCQKPRRALPFADDLRYYTAAIHTASFVLPAFAEKALSL